MMTIKKLCFFALVISVLSSFHLVDVCDYTGSNIEYIREQTQKGIDADDLKHTKFFAYKALNTIEKSKKQIDSCGCDLAKKHIYKGLENLKKATKTESLSHSKELLLLALGDINEGIKAIKEHKFHNSEQHLLLAMNTNTLEEKGLATTLPTGKLLQRKIDSILMNYEKSLDEVVNTVDCYEAKSFAEKIYLNCEKELLRQDLTEAVRYYNLKTKEITKRAITQLGNCKD